MEVSLHTEEASLEVLVSFPSACLPCQLIIQPLIQSHKVILTYNTIITPKNSITFSNQYVPYVGVKSAPLLPEIY